MSESETIVPSIPYRTTAPLHRDGPSREQIAEMSPIELQEVLAEFKQRCSTIRSHMEAYRQRELPDHMSSKDWLKRARIALGYLEATRNAVRMEITRRNLLASAGNVRETPVQKAARIAASDERQRTEKHAFCRAASKYLDDDEMLEIWDMARKLYPECFAATETDVAA